MFNTDKLCPGCMNVNSGEEVCNICGYNTSSQNSEFSLPIKFVLCKRYLVGAEKKINGEGISYIAYDTKSDKSVFIKEYFPQGFSKRNTDHTVSIIKGAKYTFNEGLMEFIDLNEFIMNSELPSLIPVEDVFEENGTVYAVYTNLTCITMAQFLSKNGGSLKWEQARPLFLPLIDTLKGMNENGIIHGGISTDTILVGRDGKLRISDYAINKLRNSDSEFNDELFPGYSAIEQYGNVESEMGSYTDVYGLCASLFTVLIGSKPPEATIRITNDSMTIPSRFAEELPRHVLSALANGLQVMPNNRTQTIEAFKNELVYGETTSVNTTKEKKKQPQKTSKQEKKSNSKSSSTIKYVVISSACTAVVFLAIVAVLIFTVLRKDIFKKTQSSDPNADMLSSVPVVDSIGTIDSGAAESAVLFEVPDLKGKYYSDLIKNEEYEKFKFDIKETKEYSDKYAKGQICSQSVAPGTNVIRDTKIQVVISLGPRELKIANVLGLDESNAKIELLKQGFLYDNIEVLEKYDEDHKPGTVLEQDPKYGTKVNTDIPVTIYINSYQDSTASSDSNSEN